MAEHLLAQPELMLPVQPISGMLKSAASTISALSSDVDGRRRNLIASDQPLTPSLVIVLGTTKWQGKWHKFCLSSSTQPSCVEPKRECPHHMKLQVSSPEELKRGNKRKDRNLKDICFFCDPSITAALSQKADTRMICTLLMLTGKAARRLSYY